MVRVAINGFGRIGRMVFRAAAAHDDVEIVAINDLTDTRTLAHLLKHDSVHGTMQATVSHEDSGIIVDGVHIPVFAQKDPAALPWKDIGVDVVAECTGFFLTSEKASAHLDAGASNVVLSAPAKSDDVKTIVIGINEHDYSPETDRVVSNASCTTNCLAPLMKVIDDNFGIEAGFFSTTHSYTGDQRHVDGPHKDLRRARACAINIVPTTSGAAIAATKTMPHLAGKVTGMAVRVPTPDGSLTDFTCTVREHVSKEQINDLFANVANHHLHRIVRYTDEPIVSTDIIGDSHSCIIDGQLTDVLDGTHVRVVAWYDNEWGYSNRMVELIKLAGARR